MRIAVLGAGISGLGAAYFLSQKYHVDLYEKEDRLGGHARTTMIEENGQKFGIDTGFLVFNHQTYPLLTKLFKELDVMIENSNMSFSFHDQTHHIAYSGKSLNALFFQRMNLFSLDHWKMIKDILKFNKNATHHVQNESDLLNQSLGHYLSTYSTSFQQKYILPMGAAIWSTPVEKMLDFPAQTFLKFFKNHGLLGVNSQHQWLTISGGSKNYVEKMIPHISGRIIKNSQIIKVKRKNLSSQGIELVHNDGKIEFYDKVILAMHAPDAIKILEKPTPLEQKILECFSYTQNKATLHCDPQILYPNKKFYAAWNYTTDGNHDAVKLTYWINLLQNLKTNKDYFVSLNEKSSLKNVIEYIDYEHPLLTQKAIHAQKHYSEINGQNNTYFAGAYWKNGFHEDGLYSANQVANAMDCGWNVDSIN